MLKLGPEPEEPGPETACLRPEDAVQIAAEPEPEYAMALSTPAATSINAPNILVPQDAAAAEKISYATQYASQRRLAEERAELEEVRRRLTVKQADLEARESSRAAELSAFKARVSLEQRHATEAREARPALFASRSVRCALLTSQVNPGSLHRRSGRT